MFAQITQYIRPLYLRSSDEEYRAATRLELFFDLVIVIAFASVAKGLHDALVEGHVLEGVLHFAMAFVVVWWPWNLFTWFASAYDNDDLFYRITVMIMMAGSMIVAASLPQFFSGYDFTYTFVGYVIMRLAHVVMWVRVGIHNPSKRSKARRFIIGQLLVQLYWALSIFGIKPSGVELYVLFTLGFILELFVPWWAERNDNTSWHRHHITERFGLLNIIVLGEILLAATIALKIAFAANNLDWNLVAHAACGIIIAFAMWSLYFSEKEHLKSTDIRSVFRWGYGHAIIFAAGVATGAGLEVMNTALAHPGDGHHLADPHIAAWALSIPIALYVFGLWYVRESHALTKRHNYVLLFTASMISLTPLISTLPYLPTAMIVLCLFIRQIKKPNILG